MNSRVVVSAIVEKDGKYLMGRKPKGTGPYPDTWHLLGGGVHLGQESVEEAIKREVWEEAGIKIKNIKKTIFNEDITQDKRGNDTHYVFLIFTTQYDSGAPSPKDDIVELNWFSKEEIKKIPLNPPTVQLFKQLNWL